MLYSVLLYTTLYSTILYYTGFIPLRGGAEPGHGTAKMATVPINYYRRKSFTIF